jgi:steroid delta-isomerase-like uncharacterized protein
MTIDEHKENVRRTFEELFNLGKLALADELVTKDFTTHDAPPDAPRGPAGLRYGVTLMRTAFPDLCFELHELVGEADWVAARATLRGTHLGPFVGIPATGKTFEQEQLHLVRFVGDKVAEHRAVRDDLAMLRQLGVVPESATDRTASS